jgi:hypothetical protein
MVTKLQSRAVGFDRRESRASITCPRGLASFVTNHFIDDLVPTRLFSISGLAADIRGTPKGSPFERPWRDASVHYWH